ncbi:MAG: tyrosine-type recombinase/integrase [Oscillospiraceae bacterium]
MSNRKVTTLWTQYQRATGITITPHQLRHAYATILYEAGIDERMAMELLGHANIAITKKIYTHISSRKKGSTAATLNNFINSEQTEQTANS